MVIAFQAIIKQDPSTFPGNRMFSIQINMSCNTNKVFHMF